MAIEVHGYTPNSSGTAWQLRKSGNLSGVGSSDMNHCERVVYGSLPSSTVYFLLQNAFPCFKCHAHFLSQSSAGHSIIVKVTKDEGTYSLDHKQTPTSLKGPATPQIIYYYNNTATYVGMTSVAKGPPATFPAHPEVEDYEI
jgi:hypothetical protein